MYIIQNTFKYLYQYTVWAIIRPKNQIQTCVIRECLYKSYQCFACRLSSASADDGDQQIVKVYTVIYQQLASKLRIPLQGGAEDGVMRCILCLFSQYFIYSQYLNKKLMKRLWALHCQALSWWYKCILVIHLILVENFRNLASILK